MGWITNKRLEHLEKKVTELLEFLNYERERTNRLFDNRDRMNNQLESIAKSQCIGERYKFVYNGNLIDEVCTNVDVLNDKGLRLYFLINKTEENWGDQVRVDLENCKLFCK